MSMANILSDVETGVVFLAIIAVLVAAHEYGHYVFARLCKMGIEEFAIGMGKKVKVWRRKTYRIPVSPNTNFAPLEVSKGASFEGGDKVSEARLIDTPSGPVLEDTTEFTIRLLPIGGFVRIKGMVPEDDGSEVKIPGGFYSKSPLQRLAVLLAGPAASVISGLVVLVLVFMTYGTRKPVNLPILDQVGVDSPAAKAGLQPGDRITSIDGRQVATFYSLYQVVSTHGGVQVPLTYERGGKSFSTRVTPMSIQQHVIGPDLSIRPEITTHGILGVSFGQRQVVLGFADAWAEALKAPADALGGLAEIVRHPSTMKQEAGGAIIMVAATHAATQEGLGPTIWLAAMLSISIGIFNLLPFPPLDGGQMLMAFIELFRRGRRLSIQVQQAMMSTGLAIVALLAIVVTFFDFQRMIGDDAKSAPQPSAKSSAVQKPVRETSSEKNAQRSQNVTQH